MSRKDPKCVMLVPMSCAQRRSLRASAGPGSMGDAVRRIVARHVRDLACAPEVTLCHETTLPVQLPKSLRRKVETLAQSCGQSAPNLVAQILWMQQFDA